jgi:hypothetical protein
MKTFSEIKLKNTKNPYNRMDSKYHIYEMIETELKSNSDIEGIVELTEKLNNIYLSEIYKSEIKFLENIKN